MFFSAFLKFLSSLNIYYKVPIAEDSLTSMNLHNRLMRDTFNINTGGSSPSFI